MKRILIVSHAMEIGGAERALLGLLESIDPSRVKVDLFLLRHEGELMELIPDYINVLPAIPAYTVLGRPVAQTVKEGFLFLSLARVMGKYAAQRYNKKHQLSDSAVALEYSHKYTKIFMPPIQADVVYDLAVSFLIPHYFVAEKVKAKKKIAWIHTDYSALQVNSESELEMWSAFDYIASISDSVTESFLKVFPALRDKIILIENMLPKALIAKQASAYTVEKEMPPDGSIKLLTIGRFSYAKKMEDIPELCRRIRASGLNVKWYLVGYGGEEDRIRHMISEAGMQEYVIILGKKDNPYPYIKACDLYVQPSRYEGNCVTVREAQLLARPVVITRYATSSSQLEEDVDGIIVPMDTEACAKGIAELLRNPQKMQQLSEICSKRDYTNAQETDKIYRLIEGQL